MYRYQPLIHHFSQPLSHSETLTSCTQAVIGSAVWEEEGCVVSLTGVVFHRDQDGGAQTLIKIRVTYVVLL